MELVGIIPAAGLAKRLGKIDSSKEVLKVSYQGETQAISEFLIDYYKMAGVKKIYFVVREGKWDIPEYYKNGKHINVHISYLLMQYPYGVPFTLSEAIPFIKDQYVALGFPDMHVIPKNVFQVLHDKIKETKSELVLGVFPIQSKSKWDMVELDDGGNVVDIIIKPKQTNLKYGWSVAVWSPRFTEFFEARINQLLRNDEKERKALENSLGREIYPGDLFREFILAKGNAKSVIFEQGECIDLGTWEDFNNFNNG